MQLIWGGLASWFHLVPSGDRLGSGVWVWGQGDRVAGRGTVPRNWARHRPPQLRGTVARSFVRVSVNHQRLVCLGCLSRRSRFLVLGSMKTRGLANTGSGEVPARGSADTGKCQQQLDRSAIVAFVGYEQQLARSAVVAFVEYEQQLARSAVVAFFEYEQQLGRSGDCQHHTHTHVSASARLCDYTSQKAHVGLDEEQTTRPREGSRSLPSPLKGSSRCYSGPARSRQLGHVKATGPCLHH